MTKVDSLRNDIRRAEKLRRELESRVEEAQAEATKERKLRERSEEYCRQMQEESDRLRVRSEHGPRDPQDSLRLKAELEKLEVRRFPSMTMLLKFLFRSNTMRAWPSSRLDIIWRSHL